MTFIWQLGTNCPERAVQHIWRAPKSSEVLIIDHPNLDLDEEARKALAFTTGLLKQYVGCGTRAREFWAPASWSVKRV
jgi:hypothetical protein